MSTKLQSSIIIRTISDAIALNPTTIDLEVTERKVVDGAFQKVVSHRPLTVCLYFDYDSRKEKHKFDDKDISYISDKMKMVADKDADLLTGPDIRYTFVSPVTGEKYMINSTYPYVVEGMICGYDVDLVRQN